MTARPLIVPCLVALALSLASCVVWERSPGVLLASDPPGAEILIDGDSAGLLTPCRIDLKLQPQRIDFRLAGYKTASRFIDNGGQTYWILWEESVVYSGTWNFPLWLNLRDFVAPIKVEKQTSPKRIFVRMQIASE